LIELTECCSTDLIKQKKIIADTRSINSPAGSCRPIAAGSNKPTSTSTGRPGIGPMADGNDTSTPICTCHGKTDTTDVKHSGTTNRIPRCWKVHRRELAPLPEFANYALSGMSRCKMPSRVSDMPELVQLKTNCRWGSHISC
jgi:hypothetical protein